MHKIKIRLPATVTSLGPGIHSLGLALGLYISIEISERLDETLLVETDGEGAGRYSIGLRHPVVLSLSRMFQRLERAPLGVSVKINNQIPLDSGMGVEAAFIVAGMIGANNLLGSVYKREEIMDIAARSMPRPSVDNIVTSVLGGLTASFMNEQDLIYRALPVSTLKVVVVLPEVEDYRANTALPENIPVKDAAYNLGLLPLLLNALKDGDFRLLAQTLDDKLRLPYFLPAIRGYAHVSDAAKQAGAAVITLCGDGPALLAFAEDKHEKISKAMQEAFLDEGLKSRGWVLPIDTQGVVISAMQSS